MGKFILASCYALLHWRQTIAKDVAGGFRKKEIVRRATTRIEKGVQICVGRWRSVIGSLSSKISVEIDVVFVYPTQPRHPIRIEDVNDNERGVSRECRNVVQQLKLYSGSREALDSV